MPYLQRRIQTIAQPLRATVCSSAGCQRSRCGKDLRRKLSQDPRTELSDSLKEKRSPIIQRDSAVNRRVVGSNLTWGAKRIPSRTLYPFGALECERVE